MGQQGVQEPSRQRVTHRPVVSYRREQVHLTTHENARFQARKIRNFKPAPRTEHRDYVAAVLLRQKNPRVNFCCKSFQSVTYSVQDSRQTG